MSDSMQAANGGTLNRRGFIGAAIASGTALSLGVGPQFASADEPSGRPPAGKIGDFKISLAEWSLHKRLFADRPRMAEVNLDFPKIAREQFGIEGVEFVNQFFKDKCLYGQTGCPRRNPFLTKTLVARVAA